MTRFRALLAAALSLGLFGLLGWRFLATPGRADHQGAVRHRELAARVLGEYLAHQAKGSRVLVIGNPYTRLPGQPADVHAFEAAALRGLERGLGAAWSGNAVVHPELRPEAVTHPMTVPMPPDTTTPLSFLLQPGAWEALRRAHADAETWVSLIGVPAGLPSSDWWRASKPRLALLLPDLRLLGDAPAVGAALERGKLRAFVLNRPGAPPESAPPAADDGTEFTRRFLLITADNVKAVRAAYPGLF